MGQMKASAGNPAAFLEVAAAALPKGVWAREHTLHPGMMHTGPRPSELEALEHTDC